jgi:hypothetical protein
MFPRSSYMDSRALATVADDAFMHAGVDRPEAPAVLLLVQLEVPASDDDDARRVAGRSGISCGVDADPHVALPGDDRGASRFFALRESVPASLNARIAATKANLHIDVEKTAGDLIVPFEIASRNRSRSTGHIRALRAELRDLGSRLGRQPSSERGCRHRWTMCGRGT